MFDKNNFPYAEYADQVEEIDWSQVEKEHPNLDAAKQSLYEKAIRDYINQTKQDTPLDDYESTLKAEERFSDLRPTLGLPEKRTKDEQFKFIKPESFQSYLKSQNLEEKSLAIPIETFVDGYVNSITEDKWANPDLHKADKQQVKARLLANIPEEVSPDIESVGEFLNRSFAPKPETPVEAANKAADNKEDPGFFSSIGSAFKRSWVNEDAADAASRIANPKALEVISAEPSAMPGEVGTLEIIDDPAYKRSNVEVAAQDLVKAWDSRKAIGDSEAIKRLMTADDFSSAFKAITSDGSLLLEVMAESGVDIAEETAAQLGGGLAGAALGSEVPVVGTAAGAVVGGSTASAAAAKENAYNSFFEQQIQKYLQDKKLQPTKESVMAFYDDKEAVQRAKDDASLSSSILASGAFASSLVGGYLSVGPAAKIAARAGFRPIIKSGEVVFERVTKSDVAKSALLGAAASTAIGTGADYASKAAVGEDMKIGEGVASVVTNALGGVVDAGIGVVSSLNSTGERAQVKVGDTLYDAEGKGHVVATGDSEKLIIYGDKGASQINGNEIGKTYFQSKPTDAPPPETDIENAINESSLRPTFDEDRQSITITKPDGKDAYIINEAVSAIQSRDKPPPTLPTDLVKALDSELSATGKDAPFTSLVSQLDDLTEVDGDAVYSEKSFRLLTDSLRPLTTQQSNGRFTPIITPTMNQEQVQARQWAAELQNYATEKAKFKKPASIDSVLSGLEEQLRVVQAEADKAAGNDDTASFDTLLKRQDEINQQIAEVNRYLGKDEPKPAESESIKPTVKQEEPADVVDISSEFDGTEIPDELVGRYVDYFGNSGVLVKRKDGFFVLGQDKDYLIESGESGKTIDELGVIPLEIDFDKVYGRDESIDAIEPTYTDEQQVAAIDQLESDSALKPIISATQSKKPPTIDERLISLQRSLSVVDEAVLRAADNDDDLLFESLSTRKEKINNDIREINRYLGIEQKEPAAIKRVVTPIKRGKEVDINTGVSAKALPESLVGEYVNYQGIDGVIIKRDDGIYVVSQEGDIIIESGLSGRTIDELGITPLAIDFELVYNPVVYGKTPVIAADFDKNTFIYREKLYEYVVIEQAEDGSKAIIARTTQGEERITDQKAVLALENQKIQYEVEATHDYTIQFEAIQALESDQAVRPVAPTPRAEPRADTGKAEGSTGIPEDTEQPTGQDAVTLPSEEPIVAPPVTKVEQQKDTQPKPPHLTAIEKIRDKDLQNDLADSNLFYLATRLPDELDTSGVSLSPVAGSGYETKGGGRDGIQYRRNPSNNPDWFKTEKGAKEPTFKGINIDGDYINARYSAQDLKDAAQALKQGVPPTRRQENILRGLVDVARTQLEELRRQDEAELDAIFAKVDVADGVVTNPSKAYSDELTNRLKSTLSEDDFEFFVTRNAELPDEQYIARALAVISDPTIKADLIATSTKSPIKPAPKEQPQAATEAKIQFNVAPEERSYSYNDANFIPERLIEQIRKDGYTVETVGEGDAIRGLKIRIGGNDKQPIFATISSRGSANPKEIKNRRFTVQIGTRHLSSYGGNKRFTIPAESPAIKASSNPGEFIQSLMDAAEFAGFKVGRSSSNAVRTIARGNEKYTIRNEGGKLFVDDQPMGERVSIRQVPITKQDKLDKALSKARSANRAEYQLRNPAPKQETVIELKSRQLEKRLDYIDSPTVAVSQNAPVKLDLGKTPEVALRYARMDTAKALINPNPKGKTNYTQEDIQHYLNMLPESISSLIRLHDTAQNPARELGARGFFSSDYEGNGPQIHIDIHQDGSKTLEGIVSTISEEVAHFVFDNWTTGSALRHMSNFYSTAFQYYRAQIASSLDAYIKHYGVDMNNPTTEHQYVLVNELFSKQGTSFIDLIDNKASRPIGLTDVEVAELKRIGREAQHAFVFDMTQNATDKEAARYLAQEILKAQSSGVVGKQTVFDLKIANGRTLRIVPTAIGQYRSVIGSAESQKISRRLNKAHHPLLNFLYSNSLTGNKLMNREILRIISNSASLDSERNKKILQSDYENARMVEAILKRYGITQIDEHFFKDGVRSAFEKLGIKKASYLKAADEADTFMKEGMDVIVQRVEDLRDEMDLQIALLRQQGNLQGVDDRVLAQMINDLEVTKSTFKADWLHRRYRAYEDPDQLRIFEEMLQELRGETLKDGSLWEQKQKAEAAIRAIRAKTSLSETEKQQRIAEQQVISSKYDRLIHLHKMVHYQSGRDKKPFDNRQYVAEVKAYLESFLLKTKEYQGSNFTKVDNIQAMQGRSLDWDAPEDTSDFHEIAFLQPIQNPIENIVFSIHQQNEVLRALQANRLLAHELLVGLGGDMAHIKGSMDHTDKGSDFLGIGQQSSILKHLQVREPLALAMKDQIETQSQLNRSWVQAAVSTIKVGQTVLNPGTAINNYIGIPFMLFGNGHLLYFNKWLASNRGTTEAWKSRNHVGSEGDAYHKMIIREMHDLRVLGTGLNAGTLDINYQGSLYQKALQRLTDGFSLLGRDDLNITSRAKVDKTFELIHDFYKFSDDAPKILSYMIERDKAELKWKSTLKRDDFDSAVNYEQELARLIKREAADKTLRQYTDWAAMPDLLKKATHSQFRVLMGDYVTFVAQMAKTMIEGPRILLEDMNDYSIAKAGNHTEWQASLRRSIMSRSVGMAGVYSGIAFGAANGYMLLPVIANSAFTAIAEMTGEDAEESMKDDLMSSEQRIAMSKLLAFFDDFKGGAKFEPLAVKEGDYVIAINAMRPNPNSVFMPLPIPSTETELVDQTTNFVRNLALGGGDTIGSQLLDAFKGEDRYGNKLENSRLDNMSSVVSNLATPGVVKSVYELSTGQSWYTQKFKDEAFTAASLGGLSMKRVHIPSVATQIGYEAQKYKAQRDLSKQLIADLKSGSNTLSPQNIVGTIEREVEANQKRMRRYNAFLENWTSAGYSKAEAIKHATFSQLENKATTFHKGDAAKLFNGIDIFSLDTLKDLNKALVDVKKKPVSQESFPQEFKDRAVKNIEFAIKQYKTGLPKSVH